MLRFVLCCVFIASRATAGYPDGSTDNAVNTDSNSNAFGYGYSGSFSGDGASGVGIPGGFLDFQRFLTSYLDSINKYHQEFIRNLQTIATQSAQGAGGVSNQAAAASGGGPGVYSPSNSYGGVAGGFGGGFAGVPIPSGAASSTVGGVPNLGSRFGGANAAFAGGSVGPDGIQQTAAVFPENPGVPNINTRIAGSGQPGGFRSVFTSSQSHTTNVNGKPQTVQQASTTVNDNGKITTYTAKNP